MKTISALSCAILVLNFFVASGQDDLLKKVEGMQPNSREYTIATFKGTRLVNGHSIETKKAGELEMIISHRFGRVNTGAVNFWGLDEAFIRIGLEYGLNDRFTAGIGRNSFNKIYDGFLKYRLLRQSAGPGATPVTITAFSSMAVQSFPTREDDPTLSFFDRTTYTYQLLIARKFSSKLSLQLMPTFLHSNRVDQELFRNDQLAIGAGGRYRLTGSVSLNGEYYYRLDPRNTELYHNVLSVGVDIETGGHVFQLIFSNTQGMVERTFITNTEGNFFEGDIHFGFNITRTFQLRKH